MKRPCILSPAPCASFVSHQQSATNKAPFVLERQHPINSPYRTGWHQIRPAAPDPDAGGHACREDGTGGEDCGVGFAPCCDGSCNDGLVCRFGEICVECGAFAQTACDGDKPCDDGLTAFNDVCLQDTGKGGPSPTPRDPSDGSGDDGEPTDKTGGAIATTSGSKGSFTSITRIPSAHKKADKPELELRAWG